MNDRKQRSVGRYRLEVLVGKGGMAEVYRATDTRLGRTVAVKMLLPSFASDATFLERFMREARLVASLEHPNVLPIYDFGEEEGVPYLVMPHVEGGSLMKRIGVSGLPVDQAARFGPPIADALDAAHAAGILHRDVKPSNVLLDRNERPLLADFGIALHANATSRLTATGAVMGTAAYMAPELAQGAPASPASDRYALGVVLYEMLAGRPPFDGETPLAILNQHVRRAAPPLTTLVPSLPRQIDEVFARALAKKPEERPKTCVDLAKELTDLLARVRTSSSSPLPAAPRAEPRPSAPPRVHVAPPIHARRLPWRWVLAGVTLVVALVLGWALVSSRTPEQVVAAPPPQTRPVDVPASAEATPAPTPPPPAELDPIPAEAAPQQSVIAVERKEDRTEDRQLLEAECRAGQTVACRRIASLGRAELKRPPVGRVTRSHERSLRPGTGPKPTGR